MGAAAWVVWLLGCGSPSDPSDTWNGGGGGPIGGTGTLPHHEPGSGWVRVLSVAAGVGPVDVFLDGQRVLAALPYLAGTPYQQVDAGPHRLQFVPTGASLAHALTTSAFTVAEDAWVSLTLLGPANAPSALVIADDRAGLADGQARVQIVHATPALPTVGVWGLPARGMLASVGFGQLEAVDLPAGGHTLELDLDHDGSPDEVYTPAKLAAGGIVDLYVTCTDETPYLVSHDAYGAVTVAEHEPAARVRVLHAAPGVDAVDAWLDALPGPLAVGVPFEEGTPYVALPGGVYDLTVSAAGQVAADPALVTVSPELAADAYTTVVAWGWNGHQAIVLGNNAAGISPSDVRLQVVHAGEGLGPIDMIDPYTGSVFVANLWPGNMRQTDIPPGPWTFGIDDDDDGLFESTFEVPYLGTGEIVEMVIIQQDGVPKMILFFADHTSWFLQPEGWG